MNCTILGLFLKVSTANSPLLMTSSYSTPCKYLLNSMRIANSISSFYKSTSIKPHKLMVTSSYFYQILDAAFHIDSDPVQYHGEKIKSIMNLDVESSFTSCFFYFTAIISRSDLYFNSCIAIGGIKYYHGKYRFIEGFTTYIIQCTFDDNYGQVYSKKNMYMNYTKFNLCLAPNISQITRIYKLIDMNFVNYTKNRNRYAIQADTIKLNYGIFSENSMSSALFDHNEDTFISNSVFYGNDNGTLSQSTLGSAEHIYYDNSCIFVNDASRIFFEFGLSFEIIFNGCYINLPQSEIINGYSTDITFLFTSCVFETTECNILNYQMIPAPKRKKFNYKIIGDIEEEFEYELDIKEVNH